MSISNPVFPNRDEIKKQLDTTFETLKGLAGIKDISGISAQVTETEKLLAENTADSLLRASACLRDIEIQIEAIKKFKTDAETARARFEGRQSEARTAMTPALEAILSLRTYNPEELAQLTEFARPDLLKNERDTAQALSDELRQVIKQFVKNEVSSPEFTFLLKDIEERAKLARAKMDSLKTGSTPAVVGLGIILLSVLITLVIAFWGRPGNKDAFLEKVPWSVLVSASFGVLFMIIGVMSEKVNEFDIRKIPDYFHRFAQAWVYTILLTLILPVSYTVDLNAVGTTASLPLDDVLIGFFVGMFVYQVEKALKEVGIRLLPVEKFLEKKQLIQPSAWAEALKAERKELFADLETAVENKSIKEEDSRYLLEQFTAVDTKIAAGDEVLARSAVDALSVEIKRRASPVGNI